MHELVAWGVNATGADPAVAPFPRPAPDNLLVATARKSCQGPGSGLPNSYELGGRQPRSGSVLVGARLADLSGVRDGAEERLDGFVILDPLGVDVVEPLVRSFIGHRG
jgi:hypothetical protein